MNIQYRAVGRAELTPRLFAAFDRRQEVVNCYRRGADGTWRVRPDPFLDDWSAEERYQTMVSALRKGGGSCDLAFVQALLAGRYGFLCQYNRAAGRDTVWSVVYDLRGGRIYRSEGNPGRQPFREDRRFAFQ